MRSGDEEITEWLSRLRRAVSDHETAVRCRGCREGHTPPSRFHLDVVLDHLEEVERHGRRCRLRPHAYRTEYVHGVHRIALYCEAHASMATWTKEVPAAEAASIVRAYVDAALSGNGPG
ncbi:hypothetical protein GCM10010306_098720 [Streptomyces umbrinus]|nr:hypothetical protein GCM10010306_098720 [Streptomyces umbrinus]